MDGFVTLCCRFVVQAHPGHQHFAAAECGVNPVISVFEYPSLKLYRILRGGADRSYVNMDFRQDHRLLCLQRTALSAQQLAQICRVRPPSAKDRV